MALCLRLSPAILVPIFAEPTRKSVFLSRSKRYRARNVLCCSTLLRLGVELPTASRRMMHKYSIGQAVDFESAFQHNAARGQYKITRLVPVERDNRVLYRIKNPAEVFERTAEEYQLTLAPA